MLINLARRLCAPLSFFASFFRIRSPISSRMYWALSSALFLLTILVYSYASYRRHQEDPLDKMVPTAAQLLDGVKSVTIEKDRSGDIRLLVDTLQSGKLFLIGFFVAAGIGIPLGLHMGAFPRTEALFLKFMTVFSMVPPLIILPILFMTFGLEDQGKIALMVIGVLPTLVLDTHLRAKGVPQEQIISGMTLGASDLEIAYTIILPRIFPKVLDTLRLNFRTVVQFLLAAEMISAQAGLGYRTYLFKRGTNMHQILPYVIWISLLMYLLDLGVRTLLRMRRFSWVDKE